MSKTKNTKPVNIRAIAVTAMLSALAIALMHLSFKVPFMPPFISMDFSDLPALLASFSLGPVYGAAVCLIKNAINLLQTQTGGVGELSNFILSCAFVVPAGLLYKRKKTKGVAMLSALLGAFIMAFMGFFSNYYLVYPIYTNFMPMEAIIGAYQAILPSVKNLPQALLIFNCPFTFGKALCSVIITMLIYKPLSPILKGKAKQ